MDDIIDKPAVSEEITKVEESKVVYDRNVEMQKPQPEFKPGEEAAYLLGEELLNGKVDWFRTLVDIFKTSNYTLSSLSEHIGVNSYVLQKILDRDVSPLSFKAGAKLLGIHCQYYPEADLW